MSYMPPPPAPVRQPKPPPSFRKILLGVAGAGGLVALSGVAAALDGDDPASTTPTSSTAPPAVPTGAPAADPVLTSIAAEANCLTLQGSFDQAAANHEAAINRDSQAAAERTVEIMKAVDARMRQLGC